MNNNLLQILCMHISYSHEDFTQVFQSILHWTKSLPIRTDELPHTVRHENLARAAPPHSNLRRVSSGFSTTNTDTDCDNTNHGRSAVGDKRGRYFGEIFPLGPLSKSVRLATACLPCKSMGERMYSEGQGGKHCTKVAGSTLETRGRRGTPPRSKNAQRMESHTKG